MKFDNTQTSKMRQRMSDTNICYFSPETLYFPLPITEISYTSVILIYKLLPMQIPGYSQIYIRSPMMKLSDNEL